MISAHTHQEVEHTGMIVRYSKRITKVQEAFIRGYAAALLVCNYDEP